MGRMRFMAEMVQTQLNDVLVGLAQRDVQKALAVWRKDEDVDAMHNSIFRELFTYMMEDPLNIGSCINLLLGAKNIERIGDHATNIAEQIYFAVFGAPIAADRPKRDITSSILVFPEPNVPKTQLLSQAHESKDFIVVQATVVHGHPSPHGQIANGVSFVSALRDRRNRSGRAPLRFLSLRWRSVPW